MLRTGRAIGVECRLTSGKQPALRRRSTMPAANLWSYAGVRHPLAVGNIKPWQESEIE